MNANRKPVAVVVGATSKWQADGRNTLLAHGQALDDSALPVGARWGVGGAIAQKFAQEGFVVILTTLIAALKLFAPVFVLTAAGPDNATMVPSYLTYYHFFTTQRVGYAAAIAVVQMILTVGLAVIFLRFQARQQATE